MMKPSVFWSIRQGFPAWLKLLLTIVSLIIPLAIWSVLSYNELVNPQFLPTPTAVLRAGIEMFASENLILDIFASFSRVFAGFLVAAIVGIPLGIAIGTFYSMESLFGSIVRY